MNLEQGQELHGFTVLTAEPLPEIDGDAYTLSHPVSGAKLLYLRNDDRNKAFSIAFRTPPADDTGVFHILEHSVLCGSEKLCTNRDVCQRKTVTDFRSSFCT